MSSRGMADMIVASSQQAAISKRVESICKRRTLNGKMITNNLSSVITTTKQNFFLFRKYTRIIQSVTCTVESIMFFFPAKLRKLKRFNNILGNLEYNQSLFIYYGGFIQRLCPEASIISGRVFFLLFFPPCD